MLCCVLSQTGPSISGGRFGRRLWSGQIRLHGAFLRIRLLFLWAGSPLSSWNWPNPPYVPGYGIIRHFAKTRLAACGGRD